VLLTPLFASLIAAILCALIPLRGLVAGKLFMEQEASLYYGPNAVSQPPIYARPPILANVSIVPRGGWRLDEYFADSGSYISYDSNFLRWGWMRSEGRMDRSDNKSIAPPSYITNKPPLVASLLASPIIPTPFATRFAHCRFRHALIDIYFCFTYGITSIRALSEFFPVPAISFIRTP
jgi:hypothetical protein